MILAQKQKYRSMERDRKPRDKPMHQCQSIYDKGGKNTQWKKERIYVYVKLIHFAVQ